MREFRTSGSVGAAVERVVQGGQTTWRRYIGDVAIQIIENSSVQTRYVYKDVLGSIVTTTNAANVVMAEDGRRSHAPDGRYRSASSPTQVAFDPPASSRNADSPTRTGQPQFATKPRRHRALLLQLPLVGVRILAA